MHLGEIGGGYVNQDISGSEGDTCVFSWVHKIRGCYIPVAKINLVGIQMGLLLGLLLTIIITFNIQQPYH